MWHKISASVFSMLIYDAITIWNFITVVRECLKGDFVRFLNRDIEVLLVVVRV